MFVTAKKIPNMKQCCDMTKIDCTHCCNHRLSIVSCWPEKLGQLNIAISKVGYISAIAPPINIFGTCFLIGHYIGNDNIFYVTHTIVNLLTHKIIFRIKNKIIGHSEYFLSALWHHALHTVDRKMHPCSEANWLSNQPWAMFP